MREVAELSIKMQQKHLSDTGASHFTSLNGVSQRGHWIFLLLIDLNVIYLYTTLCPNIQHTINMEGWGYTGGSVQVLLTQNSGKLFLFFQIRKGRKNRLCIVFSFFISQVDL